MELFKIFCYTENSEKLFNYESHVIPMIDDVYAQPNGSPNTYKVTKRILHTDPEYPNIISIWLKQTNKPL